MSSSEKHKHYLLCKPYGYVSQFVSNQRYAHKKKYLGELFDFPEGTMAIGRLDEASEGLLILSTDGVLSERVRSKEIEKEYWVQLDGLITNEAIQSLREGPEINVEGRLHQCLPSMVNLMQTPEHLPQRSKAIRGDHHGPTSWISICIREGKFRQIRKMSAAVGFPCLRLLRYRIGGLEMDEWTAGYCRELSSEDLKVLLEAEQGATTS